jgi:hypothetical protein
VPTELPRLQYAFKESKSVSISFPKLLWAWDSHPRWVASFASSFEIASYFEKWKHSVRKVAYARQKRRLPTILTFAEISNTVVGISSAWC